MLIKGSSRERGVKQVKNFPKEIIKNIGFFFEKLNLGQNTGSPSKWLKYNNKKKCSLQVMTITVRVKGPYNIGDRCICGGMHAKICTAGKYRTKGN